MTTRWRELFHAVNSDSEVSPRTHLVMAAAGLMLVAAIASFYRLGPNAWIGGLVIGLVFVTVYFWQLSRQGSAWLGAYGMYLFLLIPTMTSVVADFLKGEPLSWHGLGMQAIAATVLGVLSFILIQLLRLVPDRKPPQRPTFPPKPAPKMEHFHAAFALEPIYPSDEQAMNTASAIGGAPWLPPELQWPVDERGIPLSFFAQLKLDDIPRANISAPNITALPDFPDSGMLFFFLRVEYEYNYGEIFYGDGGEPVCKLLYSPGGSARPPASTLPANLPVMDPSVQEIDSPWLMHLGNEASFPGVRPNLTLPRVALRALPCLSNIDFSRWTLYGAGQRFEAIKQLWLDKYADLKRNGDVDVDEYDPREVDTGFPRLVWEWLHGIEDTNEVSTSRPLVPVPPSYPWHWIQIERTAFTVLFHLEKIQNRGNKAATAARGLSRHEGKARQWILDASGHELFSAVDSQHKRQFHTWLQQLSDVQLEDPQAVLRLYHEKNPTSDEDDRHILWSHQYYIRDFMKSVLKDSFFLAWPYCVASAQLQEVPADFIRAMESGHIAGNGAPFQVHQMFGELQPVYQMDDPAKRGHIPLLHIASDYGANISWGNTGGAVSFWIDPAALARADFSDVVARFHM